MQKNKILALLLLLQLLNSCGSEPHGFPDESGSSILEPLEVPTNKDLLNHLSDFVTKPEFRFNSNKVFLITIRQNVQENNIGVWAVTEYSYLLQEKPDRYFVLDGFTFFVDTGLNELYVANSDSAYLSNLKRIVGDELIYDSAYFDERNKIYDPTVLKMIARGDSILLSNDDDFWDISRDATIQFIRGK